MTGEPLRPKLKDREQRAKFLGREAASTSAPTQGSEERCKFPAIWGFVAMLCVSPVLVVGRLCLPVLLSVTLVYCIQMDKDFSAW